MGRWEAEPIIPSEGPIPLGARIRARRWVLGFTRDDLAEAVGCTPNYISVLESGTKNPAPVILERISSSLRFQTSEGLLAATQEEIIGWINSRDPKIGKGRSQARQRPKASDTTKQRPPLEPKFAPPPENQAYLEASERTTEIIEIMKDPNIPPQVKNAFIKSLANLIELAKAARETTPNDNQ